MKLQVKKAGGGKREQHPSHPRPKPSSVQSAVGCARQGSDPIATKKHVRTDHQPSQKSSYARNQPSHYQTDVTVMFNKILSVQFYLLSGLIKKETKWKTNEVSRTAFMVYIQDLGDTGQVFGPVWEGIRRSRPAQVSQLWVK